MKTTKMLAIVAIFVAGLTFTSCKKCIECTVSFSGYNGSDTECYENNKAMKAEKAEIDKDCEEINKNGGTCKCKAV
ncbi:MAG: hypothetical protein H0V01_08235 [Bacteroidetes bacterium]|nr:hypothetical protein [Bacteroidota bacterium]HET6243519.1 hypothetical protein [Bacteroidia bacterium]